MFVFQPIATAFSSPPMQAAPEKTCNLPTVGDPVSTCIIGVLLLLMTLMTLMTNDRYSLIGLFSNYLQNYIL